FGSQGKTAFRGGYAIVNDYYGQALAVQFDLANTLGFTSNTTLAANTFDISTSRTCGATGCPLAPQFTGFDMQIRPLPGITVPGSISFPRQQPSDNARRIEGGVDEGLRTPLNHVWNFTIERELPWGLVVQTNYTGRLGRNLLAQRDIMALNNLVDPATGMDWYTAAGVLEAIRNQIPQSQRLAFDASTIASIPYFENVFSPAALGGQSLSDIFASILGSGYANLTATQTVFRFAVRSARNDWTFTQDIIDSFTGINFFFNPQYGALSAWGTIGNSNYHGGSLSVRQRLRGLLWDFNYTFSHSFDDGSALQSAGQFSGAGFILNAIRQEDFYAPSGFDIRHQVNISTVYELPFGRGRQLASSVNRGVDALIGGWTLSGIFRWNTGLPVSVPFDGGRWATNWNLSSRGTLIRDVKPCISKGDATTPPKFFSCNTEFAYQSTRSAFPGETGMRNHFRLPGYVNLDMGLFKSFTMPYNEGHKLQLRWEVFNVTNTQRLGGLGGTTSIVIDPLTNNSQPPPDWWNLTSTQGDPRIMQIGFRFEF
ncbi:MAG: hypothetical protein ACRD5G_05225, partial [Candidatus Acidiferrales bacterium]